MESIVPRRQNRAKCSYRPLQRAKMFIPPASTGKMFIPPETWLPAANYALARNATFSINLDTKRRVHLERHGSDVTRVTLRTRHNRHHDTLGTQSTILCACFELYTEKGVHWTVPSIYLLTPVLYSIVPTRTQHLFELSKIYVIQEHSVFCVLFFFCWSFCPNIFKIQFDDFKVPKAFTDSFSFLTPFAHPWLFFLFFYLTRTPLVNFGRLYFKINC